LRITRLICDRIKSGSGTDDEPSSQSTPAPASKEAAPTTGAPTRPQRGRGGPASRGGRYYQRGGKPSAPQGEGGEGATEEAGGEPKKRFEGEGRGRGRGRGRGGDRGRGGRGRAFDRHSATGKTDSDKKVHQGWGGDEGTSELKAEAGGETDAQAEATDASGWGVEAGAATEGWGTATETPAEGEAAATPTSPAEGERGEGRPRREREPEEEDNTLTLDQYFKQQKEKELEIVPKLETRKANEGDDSIWKDAVVVGKKDEEETAYFVGKTNKSAPKSRAKKEEKVFIEIDARFERPARGGRGRGDRGERGERSRGGRSRGGGGGGGGRGRANGGGPSTLDVDDQAAFPSLA